MTDPTAYRLKIKQQPQRQDSLEDQLRDLHHLAARVGMYDAADWLWKNGLTKEVRNKRTFVRDSQSLRGAR